jgi:hypothetical protein
MVPAGPSIVWPSGFGCRPRRSASSFNSRTFLCFRQRANRCRTITASVSLITSFLSRQSYPSGGTPPIHIPFYFEAAILSRIRSAVTSRSHGVSQRSISHDLVKMEYVVRAALVPVSPCRWHYVNHVVARCIQTYMRSADMRGGRLHMTSAILGNCGSEFELIKIAGIGQFRTLAPISGPMDSIVIHR